MASFYENISGYTVTQTDKAYFTDIDVANEITVNGVTVDLVTLADLVNTPTFTGSISSLGLSVGDNNLINVGAGNDLQIYHDGSHSYIKDAGTGDLKIQGGNVAIQNISGGNIFFANSQAAFLDWRGTNGAGTKLSTTETGIHVTGTVTADGVSLGDNEKIKLGASQDLEIYHNGSDSYIIEKGAGDLNIQSNGADIKLFDDANSVNLAAFVTGGAAKLYWAGNNAEVRLATTETGINVTGTVTADLLTLHPTGGASEGGQINFQRDVDDSNAWYVDVFGATTDTKMRFVNVNDGLSRLEIDDSGIDVTGTVKGDSLTIDNGAGLTTAYINSATGASILTVKSTYEGGTEWQNVGAIEVGGHDKAYIDLKKPDTDDTDLRLLHDGDGSLTAFDGDLFLQTTSANTSGKVALRNGTSTKLETTSTGIDVTGTVTAGGVSLGDNEKIQLGASQDLEIFHDGTNSYVQDAGDGGLILNTTSGNGVFIHSATETMGAFHTNGAVNLYHDNAEKFATTATGIDVTGAVTADQIIFPSYLDDFCSIETNLNGTSTNLDFQLGDDDGDAFRFRFDHYIAGGGYLDALKIKPDVNVVARDKFIVDVTGTVEADAFSGTGNTAITDFITDVSASNNDTTVPTTAAVKSYVDNNDGDTTYTGGTGLTLDGTTFNVDAAQTQITSVGALDAGSITSGFGDINNGTNSVTTNGVLISDSTSGDDTKPELKFYKDVNSDTGDFIGEVVFESKDTLGNDTVFAEIRAQARFSKNYVLNDSRGAIHFNIADGTGGGVGGNLEKPSCVIDSTGVRINSENSDGSLSANYFHVDNINLVTGTQSGGLKFNSHTLGNASNKTTRIISKNITEDHAISVPNVSGSLVVAAIAGGSINGGGGTTSPKSTWSESNFSANVNTTYIHYNPLNTTDLTVSPEYPSDGYGEFFKFLNASPQSSEIVIDLDGYSGSSVASYALTKTDGSLNTTINTSANSTITVASGGFVTLTKVAFAVYLVEGIGYTYS